MSQTAFSTTLFTALAADGNTAAVTAQSSSVEADVFVEDSPTWGSGTLTLQCSPDGGTTWLSTGSTWTSGGGRLTSSGPINVIGATAFRLALTGSTSPTITPQLVLRRLGFRDQNQVTFTANATSSTVFMNPLPTDVGVYITGTFGSGTVKFQVSPDGGTTWYTVHSKTSNNYTKVSNLREGMYRFVLSGATSPALTCVLA